MGERIKMISSFRTTYSVFLPLVILFLACHCHTVKASTDQVARPLGVLISPIPSVITSKPDVNSKERQKAIKNQAPPPLGILIDKDVGFEKSPLEIDPKFSPMKVKIKPSI